MQEEDITKSRGGIFLDVLSIKPVVLVLGFQICSRLRDRMKLLFAPVQGVDFFEIPVLRPGVKADGTLYRESTWQYRQKASEREIHSQFLAISEPPMTISGT